MSNVCSCDDSAVGSEVSRRALQVFLIFLATVALVAGLATVLFGAASLVGAEVVSGTVDSEMRFYATWYAGAGILLLRSVCRLETDTWIIRGIAGTLFVAGCSRALSWIAVGEPHLVAQVLMVIELVLPFVIVPWHAAVVRVPREESGNSSP